MDKKGIVSKTNGKFYYFEAIIGKVEFDSLMKLTDSSESFRSV